MRAAPVRRAARPGLRRRCCCGVAREVPLQLRVTDEHGAVVYGTLPPDVDGGPAAVPDAVLSGRGHPVAAGRRRRAAALVDRGWRARRRDGDRRRRAALLADGAVDAADAGGPRAHRAGAPPLDRAGADAGRLRGPRVAPAQDAAVAAERRHRDAADGPHPLAREAVGVPRHDPRRERRGCRRWCSACWSSRASSSSAATSSSRSTSARWCARPSTPSRTAWPAGPGRFEVLQVGPGPFVRADPAALEQVVANLLDNAVKYSRAGPAGDRHASAPNGSTRVVEVIDRGVGIAAERARGGSSSASTARRAPPHRQGFGLGLPIVRELRARAGRARSSVTSTRAPAAPSA